MLGWVLSAEAAKGWAGGLRPAAEAVVAARRLPCGARVHGPAQNSLRSLRSLRSDSLRQVSLRSALRARAMNPALLGASHAGPSPPAQPFAATGEGVPPRTPPSFPERQAVPGGGAVCGAEQHSLEGGARSALRELACRILFERSERSERSELCGTPSGRAAQGSLSAAKAATVGDAAGRRLPRFARICERQEQTDANARNGPRAARPHRFRPVFAAPGRTPRCPPRSARRPARGTAGVPRPAPRPTAAPRTPG